MKAELRSYLDEFKVAVTGDDLAAARALLHLSDVLDHLDSGIFDNGCPPLLAARSTEMVDLLLEAGADIVRVSEFWAPGFWLDGVPTDVGRHLAEKGAELTIHAAAALGIVEAVRNMLRDDRALLEAPGGDGGTPLHFARNLGIAEFLVENGANLDARDEDHRSTPAQWCIKRSPEITRFLLDNGAEPDIFLAAGLGDVKMAKSVLASNPDCVTYRIGNNSGPFPGIGFEGTGGSILQWNLGFNLAPQEVALKRGFREVFEVLMGSTPPKHSLLIACMIADEAMADSLLDENANLVDEFDDEDRMLLAKACWETNNDTAAIRLMVNCGFPLGIPEPNHGYSPLHNAAWSGNAEVVRLLLEHGHPVDMVDPKYDSTAAGYAIHNATVERRNPEADFGGVIDALINAGLGDCLSLYPVNHAGIDTVLKKHLDSGS